MTVSRRGFLLGTAQTMAQAIAMGTAANLIPNPSVLAAPSDSRIDVLLDEAVGTISPDLYGYLLENLGTVIYDGIWVGERSKIPNIGGIRKSVIDRLRDIKASVIRWPGGNFADYYDWEDGIGPRARRPRRTNQWTNEMPANAPDGPQRYDPNWFGTPELLQLCRLTGGRAFLSANVRSLTPQSFFRWVEYCNSPPETTTLADARKGDGSRDPHGVRYWSIGNEVWAAGGSLTGAEYAFLYKRFVANVPRYGVDLSLVAAGPPPGWDMQWLHEFLDNCMNTVLPTPIHAVSLHYYATLPLNYMRHGETALDLVARDPIGTVPLDAVQFATKEWYQTLYASIRLNSLIDSYWETIGAHDFRRKIKIAVDEWGAIYKRTPTQNPLNLTGRGVTMRDALAASLTLDILNARSSILTVANYTGLVNQEGGILLADGDKFCTTPVFHVFKMFAGHQGGRALRTLFDVAAISTDETKQPEAVAHLSGSASIRDNQLTLTVTNPHATRSHDARISIRGGQATTASVSTLVHSDLHAQNSFENPDNVAPTVAQLRVNGSSFNYSFPAASVTSFTMSLNAAGS